MLGVVEKNKSVIPHKKRVLVESNDVQDSSQANKTNNDDVVNQISKHSICVETLMGGYVQSFVDFFYLSHRPDPQSELKGLNLDISIPVDDMIQMQENLTKAEAARRVGDTKIVFKCYDELASYFRNHNDAKTGLYFYEKCLEISRLTLDVEGEMGANHNLGLTHELANDISSAITFHEMHLKLAKKVSDPNEQRIANLELLKVYRKQAEKLESSGDFSKAAVFHGKCLAASKSAGDKVAEGRANYFLGKATVKINEADQALVHLDNYLEICKSLADLEGQGAACSALSVAYQQLEDNSKAIKYLEQYLEISKETKNLAAQADACNNLGAIYNTRGSYEKAVNYFEKNFDICRQLLTAGNADLKLVDKARISLGMAKGNLQMKAYVNVINNDKASLLRWKSRRTNFGIE